MRAPAVRGRHPRLADGGHRRRGAAVADVAPAAGTAALERVIGRCLAKDPEDRWQTARDLAAELRWIAEPGSGTIPRRTGIALAGRAAPRSLAALPALCWPAQSLPAIATSMWPRPVVAEYTR